MEKNSRLLSLIMFLAGIIIFSFIGFFIGKKVGIRDLKLSYISQKEILDLERERMSNEPMKDRELFLGHPEKALDYIKDIQDRRSKKGEIILLTKNMISGKNVRSISREIHTEIINNLGKDSAK